MLTKLCRNVFEESVALNQEIRHVDFGSAAE
jgi:hypothetical protein